MTNNRKQETSVQVHYYPPHEPFHSNNSLNCSTTHGLDVDTSYTHRHTWVLAKQYETLFQSIAPAVSSCDDRLSRLETSQNILMENLTLLEAKLFNLRETNGLAKSALQEIRGNNKRCVIIGWIVLHFIFNSDAKLLIS